MYKILYRYFYFCILTSARAVTTTPAAGLSGVEEDKTKRLPRQILEEQGAESELDHPRQGSCRGDLHSTSKSITLGAESSDTIDDVKDQDLEGTCLVAYRPS